MPASFDQVTADALALSADEREELLNRLLVSLCPDEDEPLSAEWEAEIQRRVQEVENGAETFPVEDVVAELRAELHRKRA